MYLHLHREPVPALRPPAPVDPVADVLSTLPDRHRRRLARWVASLDPDLAERLRFELHGLRSGEDRRRLFFTAAAFGGAWTLGDALGDGDA